MKKLAFIPTDPLCRYQDGGFTDLYSYYNPTHYFDEVYCVSPFPEKYDEVQGIPVISVNGFTEYVTRIRELKPDVIRAYGAFYAADLVNYYRIDHIPVITSVHDVARISPSVRYSDEVFCMSQVVAEKVGEIGVPSEKVRLLPNRVDTSLFSDRRGQQRTKEFRGQYPDGKMLLCVARLSDQKNTDNVVRSIKYLPEEYFVVFVGRGDRGHYQALAEHEGVGKRCFWVDHVEKSELPYWYSAADCFYLPTRWEGFGIVLIEAAACGTPIVSSDIAPVNEFLNKENAVLIREIENPEMLAAAVQYACTDVSIPALTRKGVEMAKRFEKSTVDQMESDLYRELLNRKDFQRKPLETPDLTGTFAIWGAGYLGGQAYQYARQKGLPVTAFIDNDPQKQGSTYLGQRVIPPQDAKHTRVIVPNDYYHSVYRQTSLEGKLELLDFNRLKAHFCEL